MTRWEYTTATVPAPPHRPDKLMSDMGAKGWELTAAHAYFGTMVLYFKREVQPKRKAKR